MEGGENSGSRQGQSAGDLVSIHRSEIITQLRFADHCAAYWSTEYWNLVWDERLDGNQEAGRGELGL